MSNRNPIYLFPFGRPVTRRAPSASSRRPVFVLGAYPSALHVEWRPPAPLKRISAIAVDDEPTPFWGGDGEATRVEQWAAAVGWQPEWGTYRPVGRLNGSSGAWVDRELLKSLGVARTDVWITDCLDTYRASTGGGRRLTDTYAPFARKTGLPAARLPPHPSEAAIVNEALAEHQSRLQDELRTARPEYVVTLGNAALRVFRAVVEPASPTPSRLRVEGYGAPIAVRLGGRAVEWLPLAHPASPDRYQEAHAKWAAATQRSGGVLRRRSEGQ